MTRRIPPHGSEARYKGTCNRPPCRCRSCTDGHRRSHVLRELAHRRGTPPKVPSGPVTDHIHTLIAANMTRAQIARAAGVDSNMISDLLDRRWPNTRRTHAERILAVRPGTHDAVAVPATGTRRRLQALYAIGHGPNIIGRATGLTGTCITKIAEGDAPTVTRRTHDAVAAAYRTLSTTAGPSNHSRAKAARLGWHGPLAWDDIDNPDAQPDTEDETAAPIPLTSRAAAQHIAAEIRHLAAAGESAHDIARRVGRTVGYVRQQINGERGPGWRQEPAA